MSRLTDRDIEEFKIHRSLESSYWDAMNDGRWYRCGEIDKMMSHEMKYDKKEVYEKWKANEEKIDQIRADVEKQIEKLRDSCR